MLKEFYSYLSKTITDYFTKTQDVEGYKYSLTLEANDQVRGLYEQLGKLPIAKPFEYISGGAVVYRSFYLEFGEQRLIIAATIDHIKTDFLTTLRNGIGSNKNEFKNAGLFIIYDAALDSIANATESFQKEGMPFYAMTITEDIKSMLQKSTMSTVDKEIIKYELDRRINDTYKDNTSIFEYKEILAAVHAGQIKENEYKEFRLFYDGELKNQDRTKDIRKRLDENNKYFEKIDQSLRFGDVKKDLESTFTEGLIDKLDRDGWEQSITYKEIEKSVEEKHNVEDIQVKSIDVYCEGQPLKENKDYCIRGIGSTKGQLKNKDIIIFNPMKATNIKAIITLTKFPKRESLKKLDSEVKISGKKIEITFNHNENTATYECIQASDDAGSSKIKMNFCVIDLEKHYFSEILTSYTICAHKTYAKCYIRTSVPEDQIIFNTFSEQEHEIIISKNQIYQVTREEKLILKKIEGCIEEDEKHILVQLDIDGLKVQLAISDDSKKMTVITGLGVWKNKIQRQLNFEYKGNNRVVIGTNEYYTRDDFKETLEIEEKIIKSGGVAWKYRNGQIEPIELELSLLIMENYLALLQYYQEQNLLPTLTYYDETLKLLGRRFIESIITSMEDAEDGKTLSRVQQNIMQIGAMYDEDHQKQIKYSPLAPLNIAYQLKLYDEVDEGTLSDETLLKKLSPIALLPYIKDEYKQLFKPVEQWHSPEWHYFVQNELKRYKGSRSFVSKLVKEKIEEFVDHFAYLFNQNTASTIKINVVNTGDCKEVLQGICLYYVGCIKKGLTLDTLNPIQVNIYNEGGITHIFEEFSNYADIEEIKHHFEISLDTKDQYTERDVINMIREKLTFYDKHITDQQYEYGHITFIEMNQKSDTGIGKMAEISTGVSLNGLMSGVPSVHYGESYRTGYGMKYIEESDDLVKLARILNSVSRISYTTDPYYSDQCITTELDKRDEENLEKVYDASNWVTFIEPKVDLNFFKTSEQNKDLLIIHYSDQYTTASGYDAITVTRRSRQYESIIEEHLKQQGVENVKQYTAQIINMFNAVNGDWLLRLISSKSYFDKEKISILSAIKLSLAYYNHKDILWVPISLEEILRVSGGAGLKKNEGIFSAKNLGFQNNGATSDDILLVGIENIEGEVYIHYYPIEVKIGVNAANYIQKAIEQVHSTKKIFIETLFKNPEDMTLKTKLYRNFMMQLVIVSVEKFKLYEIWPEQDWDPIINSDVRRKLLNEEYTIANTMDQYIGIGSVVSFKKDLQFRHIKKQDDVIILEFTEEDGINYITKGISEIRDAILYEYNDIDKTQLLMNAYNQDDIESSMIKEAITEELENGTVGELINIATVVLTAGSVSEGENTLEIKTEKNRSMEVLFGTNQANNMPLTWYPNNTDKVLHTNTGIIGTMGTGKTQFTKSLITQMYREGKYNLEGKELGILIFDYKGDYNKSKKDFIESTNAKVYELYHLPYNPLALVNTANAKQLLPLHTASNLRETLTKGFGLGQVQSNFLLGLLMEAYENKGIRKADRSTWGLTPPTMKDVYDIYINREGLKEDSLYAAFSNLIDFEIFEPDASKTKPLFELIEGVTVIDLSGYDESVQNLVVAITLDLFYAQMQAMGHSKIQGSIRQLSKVILVDEADNFLSKDFNALKKILKEGREFGVGTILSTQLLSHFSTSDNDFANYILTWVVHNVADLSTKDVKFIFNTHTKSEEEELYNKIKSLSKHYSLIKMGDTDRAMHVRDKAFWELGN